MTTRILAAALAALLMSAAAAEAQRRAPASGGGSSCAALAARVAASGKAVIPTGPGTFEEISAEGVPCVGSEVRRPAIIATPDNPQCFVGYSCERFTGGGSR